MRSRVSSVVSLLGGPGFATGTELAGAACETLSLASFRYQQWRLVPRSMR